MITQNPIIGRARKKLSGVYARTLYGKNIIQSRPKPTTIPPTKALSDSRAAFGRVTAMANMPQKSLLYFLFYEAPIGRNRRQFFTSQLMQAVQRTDLNISYDPTAIMEIGSNPTVTTAGLLFTVPGTSFTIPKSDFSATSIADTNLTPCILVLSYDLGICASLEPYTTIVGDNLSFEHISETFWGHEIFLICLWQTNIGTSQNPNFVYGRYSKES